jgi:hypothetical protein
MEKVYCDFSAVGQYCLNVYLKIWEGSELQFYILVSESLCSSPHLDFSAFSIIPPFNPLVRVTLILSCSTVTSYFKREDAEYQPEVSPSPGH